MDLGVAGFDWDKGNRDKCQKHGVPVAAIESLFHEPLAVFPNPVHSGTEERFKAIGRTDDGRGVLIVFTLRKQSDETFIRPTGRRLSTMKKKLPKLKSDKEAEEFVAKSDLTEYDLSGMRMTRFEFQPKSERVNMRLPRPLLDAVKATAAKAGVPYQRFIRQALEHAVQPRKGP